MKTEKSEDEKKEMTDKELQAKAKKLKEDQRKLDRLKSQKKINHGHTAMELQEARLAAQKAVNHYRSIERRMQVEDEHATREIEEFEVSIGKRKS